MMLDDDFEVLKCLSGLTLSNAQDLRLVVLALQQYFMTKLFRKRQTLVELVILLVVSFQSVKLVTF